MVIVDSKFLIKLTVGCKKGKEFLSFKSQDRHRSIPRPIFVLGLKFEGKKAH